MSPRDAHLALVESDNFGDESPSLEAVQPNGESELAFRLRLSVRLVQLDKRMDGLEALMNKITTRWATLGLPALSKD
jgi:hypothetical protein